MRKTLDRLQAARRQDGGFTLIELLIVIIILGILAAIVAFSIRGIQDRGELSACRATVKTIVVAQEAYYANPPEGEEPGYAASVDALEAAGLLRSATVGYGITTDDTGAVVVGDGPEDCEGSDAPTEIG